MLYKSRQIQRLYVDRKYRALRLHYLQLHPLCEMCLAEGKVNAKDLEVHHKKPILSTKDKDERKSRCNDWNNLQTLCREHHHQVHNEMRKEKPKKIYEKRKKEPPKMMFFN